MTLSRREFHAQTAAVFAASAISPSLAQAAPTPPPQIIDTHQHLWDLKKLRLPWLASAPKILSANYTTPEYRQATAGLNIKAVYMEVDVAPEQHVAEMEYVLGLARSGAAPTLAAVVGGRPASDGFAAYVKRLQREPEVKGVRQVLHVPETKPGYCLQEAFVRGVRLLGEAGLSCDLCMRPTDLADGYKLADLCPDTRFILDHCGNGDVRAFRKSAGDEKPLHEVDPWKRDIEAFAKRKHVVCKISGIIARAPADWKAEDLAGIVNHCLDSFGPDRVMFGGDWPVCLLGAPLRKWIDALSEIVAGRSAADRARLWAENAVRFYGLKLT